MPSRGSPEVRKSVPRFPSRGSPNPRRYYDNPTAAPKVKPGTSAPGKRKPGNPKPDKPDDPKFRGGDGHDLVEEKPSKKPKIPLKVLNRFLKIDQTLNGFLEVKQTKRNLLRLMQLSNNFLEVHQIDRRFMEFDQVAMNYLNLQQVMNEFTGIYQVPRNFLNVNQKLEVPTHGNADGDDTLQDRDKREGRSTVFFLTSIS